MISCVITIDFSATRIRFAALAAALGITDRGGFPRIFFCLLQMELGIAEERRRTMRLMEAEDYGLLRDDAVAQHGLPLKLYGRDISRPHHQLPYLTADAMYRVPMLFT